MPAKSKKRKAAQDLTLVNQVLSFGSGDMSQLGLGPDIRQRKNPAPITALTDHSVIRIASGALHNAALTSDGQVWTWGCNDDYALGRATEVTDATHVTDVTEGKDQKYPQAVETAETPEGKSEWVPAQVLISSTTSIREIACGDCHTVCLDDNGRVWSWGTYKDIKGIIGYDAKHKYQPIPARVGGSLEHKRVVSIAAGEQHDLALTDKGQVFEWGDLGIGRRGSDRLKCKLVPRSICFKFQRQSVKMTLIWAGGMTSFAKSSQGLVFVWGLNNYGQCGVNSRTNILTPTVIQSFNTDIISIVGGTHHTLALDANGTVYSWGRCHYGRLGHGGASGADDKWIDSDDKLVPTPIASSIFNYDNDNKIIFIAAGESHSFAITESGNLYSWGFNELCQLGLGHDKDVCVPTLCQGQQLVSISTPRKVLAASAGSQHSLVLARLRPEKVAKLN